MIPKKIHYVWVGGNEKPKDIRRCMATWKKHLSDYEIIEWNESNFDINSHPFTKSAYEAKKWAYVSDYIRAYALYEHGGIYLDTDVLVLENFDSLLNYRAFVGFENPEYPFTGSAFGAEPKHPFINKILHYYDNKIFTFDPKNQLEGVNTKCVSDILIHDFGCELGNQEQDLKEGIHVFPDRVLCNPSADSITVHLFTGTWMEGAVPLLRKINKGLKLHVTTKKRAELFRKYCSRG